MLKGCKNNFKLPITVLEQAGLDPHMRRQDGQPWKVQDRNEVNSLVYPLVQSGVNKLING